MNPVAHVTECVTEQAVVLTWQRPRFKRVFNIGLATLWVRRRGRLRAHARFGAIGPPVAGGRPAEVLSRVV
jgi:hypothetical protein